MSDQQETKIHNSHAMNEYGVCSLCGHTVMSEGAQRYCPERRLEQIRDARRGGNDWQGKDVDQNESDEDEILVWKITPSLQEAFDSTLIRGWQDMLQFVEHGIEMELDSRCESECRDGVDINIKLVPMRLGEYLDLPQD